MSATNEGEKEKSSHGGRSRFRQRKLFTLHPDAIEALRRMAEDDAEASGSMSRKLELLIFAAAKADEDGS